MRIKRFYILHGGFGDYDVIVKRYKDLRFSSGPMPIGGYEKGLADYFTCMRPSQAQWKAFLDSIKPFASTWQKQYYAEVCDDTQWEVKIITDEFSFISCGSNDYPDDFESFLLAVRKFTGLKTFASGSEGE